MRKYIIQILITISFICICAVIIIIEASRISSYRKKFLYYPRNWINISILGKIDVHTDNGDMEDYSLSIGGGSVGMLPLDIKHYLVKSGDSLSDIAHRFGMDLDTIASMNREWGSGVHLISVGEEIKIPNQDGIYISIKNSLEDTCKDKDIPPEVVLQVNRVTIDEVTSGMELFFPGVQHTGIERSVMIGTAFLRPVRGYITSGFGYRRDPFTGKIKFHRGIDIAAPIGTVIRASLDGRVAFVGYDPVIGNYMLIKHQIGYSSLYGHLHKVLVKRGYIVKRGQRIGLVGNSGRSTGPHVHFELRKNGIAINAAGLITGIY